MLTAGGRQLVTERLAALTGRWASEQAIEFRDRWLTWGDVAGLADVIDGAIDLAGVTSGGSVAIVMRQTPGALIAELAVLRAGRTAVVLTPLQADAELAGEIAELRPQLIVLDGVDAERAGIGGAITASGATVVVVDELLRASVETAGHERTRPTAEPEADAAVTVLTSGTTGRAKRMPVSWHDFAAIGGAGPGGEAKTPRSDRGALIVSVPLVTLGGLQAVSRLVFGGRPMSLMERFEVHEWAALVKRHRPRVIGAPPPAVSMILDAAISADHFEGVTAFVTSSAALPAEVMARFRDTYGIPVVLTYGATEFLGSVTEWTPELWQRFGDTKLGSAGRAKHDVGLRVVDTDGQPVGADVEGTLEVDPQRRAGGLPDGWIRTSDRARIDADGFLWIAGRTDDVIIRGGFKVDVTQIEAAALRHPSVTEACAIGLDDPRLGSVPGLLVAVGATDEDTTRPLPSEMSTWLRQRLPAHAVPARVEVVEAIPRTNTLKPDRRRVREMLTLDSDAAGDRHRGIEPA